MKMEVLTVWHRSHYPQKKTHFKTRGFRNLIVTKNVDRIFWTNEVLREMCKEREILIEVQTSQLRIY